MNSIFIFYRYYSISLFILLLFLPTIISNTISNTTLWNTLDQEDNYYPICFNSQNLRLPSSSYCDLVTWGSARLFSYSALTYDPLNTRTHITTFQQDEVASSRERLLASLQEESGDNVSEYCDEVKMWFICVDTFHFCPISSSSSLPVSSSIKPCLEHCTLVEKHCKIDLNCTNFYTDEDCIFYISSDFYLLPEEKGPYKGLKTFYLAMIVLWSCLFVLWTFLIYKASFLFSMPIFFKIITLILVLKLIMMIISWILWKDCDNIENFCLYSTYINVLPGIQVLEAGIFFLFFIMVKGWGISKQNLSFCSWFFINFITIIFLILMITIKKDILRPPSSSWAIFTTFIYGYIYLQLILVSYSEYQYIRGQIHKVKQIAPPDFLHELNRKKNMMYQIFQCVAMLLIVEIISQIFYSSNIKTIYVHIFYEVSSFFLILMLSFVLRPRQLSIYFFVFPSTQTISNFPYRSTKPMSILSVFNSTLSSYKEEGSEETEPLKTDYDLPEGQVNLPEEIELSRILSYSSSRPPDYYSSIITVKPHDNKGPMELGVLTPTHNSRTNPNISPNIINQNNTISSIIPRFQIFRSPSGGSTLVPIDDLIERSESRDSSDREDQRERSDSVDRSDRRERRNSSDRSDRERRNSSDRGDRRERRNSTDRSDRERRNSSDRGDRRERRTSSDRSDRERRNSGDRGDRRERRNSSDRSDRERRNSSDRSDRERRNSSDRSDRRERRNSGDRGDRRERRNSRDRNDNFDPRRIETPFYSDIQTSLDAFSGSHRLRNRTRSV